MGRRIGVGGRGSSDDEVTTTRYSLVPFQYFAFLGLIAVILTPFTMPRRDGSPDCVSSRPAKDFHTLSFHPHSPLQPTKATVPNA